MSVNQDQTIQGFWHDLERDGGDLDLWHIYCDYLEDQRHPRWGVTRLWIQQRTTTLSGEARSRLSELLRTGKRPLLPWRVSSIGIELVLVPRGTFWMGENGRNAQQEVTIENDLYLGIYQVTQGPWTEIMGSNPRFFSRNGERQYRTIGISNEVLLRFPVENVSWDQVQEFLKRLNQREEQSGLLYRLPSEREWEYSCRSGLTSKEDCSYDFYLSEPTNNLSSDQANFNGNSRAGPASGSNYLRRPTVVGSYEPNALGIYDMHGNVYEWCEDESGSARVIRGGSWLHHDWNCRTSHCYWSPPSNSYDFLGFRLACSFTGSSN